MPWHHHGMHNSDSLRSAAQVFTTRPKAELLCQSQSVKFGRITSRLETANYYQMHVICWMINMRGYYYIKTETVVYIYIVRLPWLVIVYQRRHQCLQYWITSIGYSVLMSADNNGLITLISPIQPPTGSILAGVGYEQTDDRYHRKQ